MWTRCRKRHQIPNNTAGLRYTFHPCNGSKLLEMGLEAMAGLVAMGLGSVLDLDHHNCCDCQRCHAKWCLLRCSERMQQAQSDCTDWLRDCYRDRKTSCWYYLVRRPTCYDHTSPC